MEATRYAYSTLPDLLTKARLTVAEMHKRLTARGFRFDKKTLYRLASPEPMQRIDAPVVGAICEEFDVNLGDLLVWQPVKPRLHRIGADVQTRLDVLMEKNNQGRLTVREKKELDELGTTVERLSMENARMLSRNSKPRPAARRGQKKRS